jgi:hypothetical protein
MRQIDIQPCETPSITEVFEDPASPLGTFKELVESGQKIEETDFCVKCASQLRCIIDLFEYGNGPIVTVQRKFEIVQKVFGVCGSTMRKSAGQRIVGVISGNDIGLSKERAQFSRVAQTLFFDFLR